MTESSELVTLTDGVETLQTPPETELSIHDAAKWSGYNHMSLRRLDKAAPEGFPPAHYRMGGVGRFWYAREIAQIVAHKKRATEEHRKRTSKIYKPANANRREAKAEAKRAGAGA